jgi:spermidine/putrescine-binding protein
MLKVFSNMLRSGCSVAHVVLVPLGGVPSAGLIRDLYDLDSWLRSGVVSNLMSLPASREALWRMLELSNKVTLSVQAANAERVRYMPENIKTSSKIRMISGEIENLPASISPMTEKDEQHVMEQLMREIADTYAIDKNKYPNLS